MPSFSRMQNLLVDKSNWFLTNFWGVEGEEIKGIRSQSFFKQATHQLSINEFYLVRETSKKIQKKKLEEFLSS